MAIKYFELELELEHLSSGKSYSDLQSLPIHHQQSTSVGQQNGAPSASGSQVPAQRSLHKQMMGQSNERMLAQSLYENNVLESWMQEDNPSLTSLFHKPIDGSYDNNNIMSCSYQIQDAHRVLNDDDCSHNLTSPSIVKPSPKLSKCKISTFSTYTSEESVSTISNTFDDGLPVTVFKKRKTPKKNKTGIKLPVGACKTACSMDEIATLRKRNSQKKKTQAIKMIKKQIRNIRQRREDLPEDFSIACIIKPKKDQVMYFGFGETYRTLLKDANKIYKGEVGTDHEAGIDEQPSAPSMPSSVDDTAASEQQTAKDIRETQRENLCKVPLSGSSSLVVTKQGKLLRYYDSSDTASLHYRL